LGIPQRRADEVLGLVGLESVANVRAGAFSLGMGQRLGIAAALIGDPATILLDEPVNGLDPEGIRWIRSLLRELADEGRTVFVSSHLMSEMSLTADHLLVIGRGTILADTGMSDFIERHSAAHVRVRSPHAARLAAVLQGAGLQLVDADRDVLNVRTGETRVVGQLAGDAGLHLHELTLVRSSLEEAFMSLTADSVDYATAATLSSGAAA